MKTLPYFKFQPAQWDNGNIQMCSRESKGLFIDLCAMYWSRLGEVPYALALQKLCNGDANALQELCTNDIIAIKDDQIIIEFLDEQLNEFDKTAEKRRGAARKRWDNANALQMQSKSNAIKIREDKIIEEDNKDVNSEINALFKTFENEIKSGSYDEQMNLLKLKFKIKYLSGAIEDFRTHLLVEGKVHPNTRELFKHFRNWLNMVDPKGVLNKYKI